MANQILTFKYRIKDKSVKRLLNQHAIASNQVWNFCVDVQRQAQDRRQAGKKVRWPSYFDFTYLTIGCAAELGIHSDTVAQVCAKFVASRDLHGKCPRFRSSFGPKKSLGFIPFVKRSIKLSGDSVTYLKKKFRFWKSRDIPNNNFRAGCFVQDARGRWYVTFQTDVEPLSIGNGIIGIDLGLKVLATCSNGDTIPALQHYRQHEATLAIQQRAGNKKRVKAIHAKIANSRHDQLHKASTKIARENSLIVVGDVNAAQLKQTPMAKSISDAGWSMFRMMLRYKASRHGATFIEADERWTSQTCSACGTIPASSPKGMGALGVRHWKCSDCGADHDRDVNAAQNILRVGLERQPLAGEIARAGKTLMQGFERSTGVH